MAILNVHAHSLDMTNISCLFLNQDERDIAIVLDRENTLDLLKSVDSSLYKTVSIETEGEYFYVSSSVKTSELYVESVQREDGRIKYHDGDILILPHYVPQEIKENCVDGSDLVIELVLESIYEKIVEIIEG
ncbi:hypothetical protein [Viridibacillus arvi]|uniref:hypothetical protein n=1 Tax=Viridibacillus arvi TaxID=263475 RepID=UPI0034CEAB0B